MNRTSFQDDGRECCAECGGPISGGGVGTTFGGTRCWSCEDAINGVPRSGDGYDVEELEERYGAPPFPRTAAPQPKGDE